MSDPFAAFTRAPGAAGLFLDFDGTLSEIVPVPSDARPVAGAADLLARLGRAYGAVVVVSGRSAGQLLEWLGPEVEIWGVHGAERTRAGRVELSDRVRPFREVMAEVRDAAEAALARHEGVTVEDKSVVVTLHYRSAADPGAAGAAVAKVSEDLAQRHDLRLQEGRKSVELRPPVELSKAAVVLERARAGALTAVMFVGDDTVDLGAFGALDELADDGVTTVRVAVRSDEAPDELLERADLVVDGPPGVIALLERLAPAPPRLNT